MASVPNRLFTSAIQRVNVTMSDRHTLVFEFSVNDADRSLRPGAEGTVEVVPEQHDGIVVPREAVLTQGTRSWVYVNSGGRARERQVRTGEVVDEGSGILAGLVNGEGVILPASGLADGRAITVLP